MTSVILILAAASIVAVAYLFREKLAALMSQVVSQVRTNVSKPDTPVSNSVQPPVYTEPSKPAPEQSLEEWLATLPASTRAYIPQGKEREYRDQLVAQAAAPVNYSGFVLTNSSRPRHNPVKSGVWTEFTVIATMPRQQIQASAQAEWMDEEVNGVLQHRRQASNPTALWLALPPGEHKYRVRLDRDAMLDVKMSEH